MEDILITKRDGSKVKFNSDNIRVAILKANAEVSDKDKIDEHVLDVIVLEIMYIVKHRHEKGKEITVEDIQDLVEKGLMQNDLYELAKCYITYRYKRSLVRKANTTDKSIKELLEGNSEYWNSENSNKNAKIVTTQRDYVAGITNTDIARRFIFPEDVVKAHDEGIIHIHDMDYAAENARINCCLINLEDMLQKGTVLNGIKIDRPKRFITACTIATQIILAVSSSDYGGTTISLTHLAPFVRRSYEIYLNRYLERGLSKEQAEKFAMEDTKKEVKDGVQTFNYQVNSMATGNGQAPFISVCMYLGETE